MSMVLPALQKAPASVFGGADSEGERKPVLRSISTPRSNTSSVACSTPIEQNVGALALTAIGPALAASCAALTPPAPAQMSAAEARQVARLRMRYSGPSVMVTEPWYAPATR